MTRSLFRRLIVIGFCPSLSFGAATATPQETPPVEASVEPLVPMVIHFSDYPIEAVKLDEKGSVRYELVIGDAGRPTKCRVVESDAPARLNRHTCSRAERRLRFAPGSAGRRYVGIVGWHVGKPYTPR